MHKFDYRWTLADAHFTKDKGTVFSCFACGGGSSMGYKLAGFDVIGCNEIDHRMMFTYCKNHNPRFPFLEPIQTFKDKQDLPPELFNLDILDGSPPCSTFSMAGSREEAWGKMKKFREGQAEQVLDTLFFDFIQLAKRLQPKVVVAENVKGLLLGSAKEYMTNIYRGFDDAGYYVNHYLLDAQTMGVPQRRQRVFFVCLRKDLVGFVPCEQTLFDAVPYLDLNFNEPPILFGEFADYNGEEINKNCQHYKYWKIKKEGETKVSFVKKRLGEKDSFFNHLFVSPDNPLPTITASSYRKIMHWNKPLYLSKREITLGSSFPLDYDFGKENPEYICGMSVPPVMIANIANKIWEQWLCRMNKKK